MKPAILVDLDGTYFDTSHRDHMVKDKAGNRLPNDQIDWPSYSAACVKDTPIQAVVELVRFLEQAEFLICFVSGRGMVAHTDTLRMIRETGVESFVLVMRPPGDRTPNGEFKVNAMRQIVKEHEGQVEFVLAIDDYPSAREALEAAGVPTILVRENACA